MKPETVKIFTTRHIKSSRRGLGFDMKELDPKKTKSTSELAPASTFGHTGFTGTAVWADPENNIVYIFCTNRTLRFHKRSKKWRKHHPKPFRLKHEE